jgi:hypothetical protein
MPERLLARGQPRRRGRGTVVVPNGMPVASKQSGQLV